MKRRRIATTAGALVSAFWLGSIFLGYTSPAKAWSTIEVGSRDRAPTATTHGSLLSARAREAARATFGSYEHVMVVRVSDTLNIEGIRQYLALLDRRFAARGTRVVTILPGPLDSATAETLALMRLDAYRHFTAVIDSGGHVRFLMRTVLGADNLRQLAERTVAARAMTEFPRPPHHGADWQRRLDKAGRASPVDRSRSPAEILADVSYLAVFEAHCSTCRIGADVRHLDSLRQRLGPGARIAAVFPTHYFETPAQALIDSLRIPVLSSRLPIDDDLAYVSRDVDAAAPRLLRVVRGRIAELSPEVRF